MRTHDQVVKKLMSRPGVRKEVARIERDEGALLDLLLKARQEAGLTQAQVAERMGTQPPAVARLERALQTARDDSDAPDALYIGLGELSDTARPFAARHRIAIWQAPELAPALRGLPLGDSPGR